MCLQFTFQFNSFGQTPMYTSTHFEAAVDSDDVEITTASRFGAVSIVSERAEIG